MLLAVMMLFALAATQAFAADAEVPSGVEDGVLTIAMECAYAPYNWTQTDDSNGAVPIYGAKDFANGYDVMMARKIADGPNLYSPSRPRRSFLIAEPAL